MFDWKQLFDQIYCIHYLPYSFRLQRLESELSRVGMLESGIFSWKYTFDSPFYQRLQKQTPLVNDAVKENLTFFKVSLAHYSVYKEALGRGFKKIIVMENDVSFLKDLDELRQIMDNFPREHDVVLLDKFAYSPIGYQNHVLSHPHINSCYCEFDSSSQHLGSAACYSVSEAAMKAFCEIQEEGMLCPDEVWNRWNNPQVDSLKRAFALKNICYQKPFEDSSSITPAYNSLLGYKFVGLSFQEYM